MPIEIRMPSATADMVEGGIARWAKQPGDAVRKGEVLLDIETDKASVEVEAPHDGVLARILAADGTQNVKVGTVIALLALSGEDLSAAATQAEPVRRESGAEAAAQSAAQSSAQAPAAHAAASSRTPGRIAASPLARRTALALNVDLASVQGSGPKGRVVKADVERAARASASAPSSLADHAAARVAGPTLARVAPAAAPAPASAPAPAPAPDAAPNWDEVPHSNVRRVIAQRMSEAKRSIPHFYLAVDCDVDALLALRGQLEVQAGIKPSINDFVVRAVALAMKAVPAINASWGEEAVRRHRSIDVSVAVATPAGLVTPIVRDADAKSVASIGAEMKDLAARARQGRLLPPEYQGGGFTISNLGMHGIREFCAIVNPPQAGILAVGACEPRPAVRGGALAVATQMTCTLSADHRIVDGAVGAEFLATFRRLVEAPLALLA